ncbi:MAG: T9SS type A sorting domain-containing protein, partial [Bacteroidia bacterium]|nr:T9SS type A sorting domain-containing protein [Bacteroidia bacterium]
DLDAVGVIHENSQIGITENYFFVNGFNSYIDENSLLHVSYTASASGKTKTELSDLSGRKIKTAENYCNAGEFYNFSLNLPDLESGIYFVSLYSQDGKKITKKIFIP